MTIKFPDAVIRYIDIRDNKEGGSIYAKIMMSSEMTKDIRKALNWGTDADGNILEDWPGTGPTGGGLEGALSAKTMSFSPKQAGLKQFKTDITVNAINSFTYKPEKGENGGGSFVSIDFIARTSDYDSILKLVEYKSRIGKEAFTVRASYEKQEVLPGMGGDGEEVSEEDAQQQFEEV